MTASVTSFTVTESYVVLTTNTHTVRFISLDVNPGEVVLTEGKAHPHDEQLRAVERGSRIVAATPCGVRLILQMPRGNLETVFPRAFVLLHARTLIRAGQYGRAFSLLRKHRVSLNLLYDCDPAAFTANVCVILVVIEGMRRAVTSFNVSYLDLLVLGSNL